LPDAHFVIDVGPGVITALGLIVAAIPATIAAYYAYSTHSAVKQGNSELAARLARIADAKAATAALAHDTAAHLVKE
jgi:hypothetical protein